MHYGFYVAEQRSELSPSQADIARFPRGGFNLRAFFAYASDKGPVARTWAWVTVSPFSAYQLGSVSADYVKFACSNLQNGAAVSAVVSAAAAQGVAYGPLSQTNDGFGFLSLDRTVTAVFSVGKPLSLGAPCKDGSQYTAPGGMQTTMAAKPDTMPRNSAMNQKLTCPGPL